MSTDDRTNNLKFFSQEYSDSLTNRKQTITNEILSQHFDRLICSLDKYTITKQKYLVRKLTFVIETLPKERDLVKMGINTFICFEDIQNYINNSKNVVTLIELENYKYSIPDEIVKIISQTNHLFNKFYIVDTDYTKKTNEQVTQEKTTILFGVFQDVQTKVYHERFYFVGEWKISCFDSILEKVIEADDFAKFISTPDSVREFQSHFTDKLPQNGFYNNKKNKFTYFLTKINPFKKR